VVAKWMVFVLFFLAGKSVQAQTAGDRLKSAIVGETKIVTPVIQIPEKRKKPRSLKNPKREIKNDKFRQNLVEKLKPEAKPAPLEEKKLFDWEILYKYQWLRNMHAGNQIGNTELSNLDIKSEVNLDQFSWGRGLKGFVNGMGNYGSSLSEKVGDTQVTSNIEAPSMFFLYQAWVEKTVLDDMFSVLVGLQEVNSEFYVTDTSVLFLNSSFGIGTEMAAAGANGPSTFPYTSVGARAKIDLPNHVYALWGVYDGVSGDPNHLTSNKIRWDSSDGLLMISEVGTTSPIKEGEKAPEVFSKFGVGVWGFTQSFDPIDSESGATAQGNYGLYAIFDKTTSAQFSYFIRAGYANKEVNSVMLNTAFGINYRSPFAAREEDIFGLGVTDVVFSPGHRVAEERDNAIRMGNRETVVEATYRISIWQDVAIQPNYQLVIHPSGNKDLGTAHVAGVHVEIGM
jgi:porin